MKRFYTSCMLMLCIGIPWLLYGQSAQTPLVEVAHFSIEQGLSDRYLNSIVADKQGFIWVATNKGLNRFDGYEFLNYDARPSNRYHIRQNKLHTMFTDRKGKLLLIYDHMQSGVMDLLDPLTGKCDSLNTNTSDGFQGKFDALKQHANGTIYFWRFSPAMQTLFRFDEDKRHFSKVFAANLGEGSFRDFLPAADGRFWVAQATADGSGLLVLHVDAGGKVLTRFSMPQFAGMMQGSMNKVVLSETAKGEVLVYVENQGIWVIPKQQPPPFFPHPRLKGKFYEFARDTKGNILAYHPAPTPSGEDCMLLMANGEVRSYGWIGNYQSVIRRVFSHDFTQGLLAGTGDGFHSFQLRPMMFQRYLSTDNLDKAGYGKSIRGMAKLGRNKLFIATELDGLFELDIASQTISKPGDKSPALRQLNDLKYCRNIVSEGDTVLWITALGGILKYNHAASTLRFFKTYTGNGLTGDHETWGITPGRNGNYWVVTRDGKLMQLNPLNPVMDTFKTREGTQPFAGTQPSYLFSARNGTIWLGTALAGLFRVNPETGETKNYNAGPANTSGFTSNHIGCIAEDAKGLLWVGTMESGLHVFDPVKEKVIAIYDRSSGLRNNSVVGLLQDTKGNFWVSTFSGLAYFETARKTFRNYTTANGLTHNEFNRHAFYLDRDYGRYYFGGMNGVNAFQEGMANAMPQHAPLLISEMWVTDRDGKVTGEQQGIVSGTTLTLQPGSKFLRLRLSLLHYGSNEGNQFAYMLDEADGQWNYLGQGRDLRIDYPPPGNHVLRIKGADIHGNWSTQEIAINLSVKEFWYKQWWAFGLYAILLAAAAYYFYRFQLSRSIAEQKAQRLQQLDTYKTRFFTNISHEFRTPLTIILGMVDTLKRKAEEGNAIEAEVQADMIKRNSKQLLNLVNQLLDLAKLESGQLQLLPANGNLAAYILYQVESFRSYAQSRGIQLEYKGEIPSLEMAFDHQKMQAILVNLISNALKFTPEGGEITVRLQAVQATVAAQPTEIQIQVADTGMGIAAEDQSRIFDRFYQVDDSSTRKDSGTGIGLALVQELVKLMQGTISVESQPQQGSCFTIRLPFTPPDHAGENQSPAAWNTQPLVPAIETVQGEPEDDTDDRPLLLITEDNADVRYYLSEHLKEHYRLQLAVNGAEGIEKARALLPDLIISDVMMPEKDGLTLCNTLKTEELTSHIPIVLLTARVDVASRIAGLRRGADAYLAKPFDPEELLVQVQNLISLRIRLQQRYTPAAPLPDTPSTNPDLELEDAFILKTRDLILQNLHTTGFDVPQLSRAIGMSRSQLFRKIKALTGHSPSLFIRTVRLQQAQVLLRDTKLSIAEIGYEVGFNAPAYFSTAFLETFGKSPGEWRQASGNPD